MNPIDHPSVWHGTALLARKDWIHTLNRRDVFEIEALVGQQRKNIPRLAKLLRQIQHDLEHGSGAVMVRGLPIDTFSLVECQRLFTGLASMVGTPISQSAAGDLVFSVRDERFGQDDPRTRGPNTNKKLSFHTDRCDVIAFLCLHAAKEGGDNQLVSSPALYNELLAQHPHLLEVLMQPFYYKRHNVDGGNEQPFCAQPIFSVYEGHFAANLLRVLIERAHADPSLPDLTPLQIEALDAVEALAEDPKFHVTFRQEPGDLVFMNNWVTLHRRTSFVDHADEALRRHLLRIWLSMPNSRPLDPLFAGNYGRCEAGAIRGGMRKKSE